MALLGITYIAVNVNSGLASRQDSAWRLDLMEHHAGALIYDELIIVGRRRTVLALGLDQWD